MESIRPGSANEELVFAVVSGDPMARTSLARVCDAIAAQRACRIRPDVLSAYGLLPERIASGLVHVAWAPPLVAHALVKRHLAVAVSCPRRPGGLAYHSALFARERSRFRSAGDLTGARAAWVDSSSLSGYVLARSWCRKNGVDPERTLARQQFLKTHSAVARAVIGGEADIGATYANVDPKSSRIVDAGWSEIGVGAGDVHVLATMGPVPSDAIVVSARVPDPMRDAIRTALETLTGAASAAVRVLFRAERFERPPASYLASLEEITGM
jgi:phosphonate transport system substrate-binding protein